MTTTRTDAGNDVDAAADTVASATRPGGAVGAVRRVVTGHDAQGRSVLLSDGLAPNTFRSPSVPGLGSSAAWTTPAEGADNLGTDDAAPGHAEIPMSPPPGGTIFRVADFPPDAAYAAQRAETLFTEIGQPSARVDGHGGTNGHFWNHRTQTLDYGIVLAGEIWMLLDEGEVLLRAGDVVVQRGTSHAWSNRTDEVCRMAFVLLGTPPLPAPADAPNPTSP